MKNDNSGDFEKKGKKKRYSNREPIVSRVSDIDFSSTYSYANYLRWQFEERLELIKGKVFEMAAPAPFHQLVSGRISGELHSFLKRNPCRIYPAPFDVRFPDASKRNKDVYTVLQPDISIVCDVTKIDRRGCVWAPDIVVEILSPSNNKKDLENKFAIYEEYGVREYWIVFPEERYLLKYVRNADGIFIADKPYDGTADFVSDLLPGFRLDINEVFED
ncbi:MAG: Uma2 family endonuclease [Candidatus Pedobacter colombiensis]|uniref:Uma2 family endonuclease n=1 Tax=Candidatus Pedobacter colombiensis TaxID=3121371 RepID=A0AAJ5WA66_9SPHI|nr:Uma2 family endonuclease [Pedobacter sp.]WEK20600.1 MAG: Uma2 family endonuclease [Pedobacter sp.]